MVKEAGSRAASTLHCQHPSAKCHCEDGETKIKRLHLCSSTIIGSHILGDVLVQPIKSFANFQYWMDLHRNQFDVQILKKNAVRISTPRIKQGFRSEKSLLTCLVANLFHIGYFEETWDVPCTALHRWRFDPLTNGHFSSTTAHFSANFLGMAMLETQRTYPNGYICQVSSEISNNSLEKSWNTKIVAQALISYPNMFADCTPTC